jgi:(p)ppGpp synthase/HD superfamily hydrolase
MALPRGATVVDFAYAIHSNVGDHTVAAKVNGEQVPLRTELKNGDVVEIITAPVPAQPGLAGLRAHRARALQDPHHLKTLAQDQSRTLGEKLLAQALRAEGLGQPPGDGPEDKPIWDKLLRFTGNRARRTAADIGLGKRMPAWWPSAWSRCWASRPKPDALLLTRARYTAHENLSQGAVTVDGSADASIKYATCCRPIPGDGYLGRGEGLVVHTDDCAWRAACSTRTPSASSPWPGPTSRCAPSRSASSSPWSTARACWRVAAAIASAESTSCTWACPTRWRRTRWTCASSSRCATAPTWTTCCAPALDALGAARHAHGSDRHLSAV